MLLSWPSWPFLCCTKLGPDNNTHLAQITFKNVLFCVFGLGKCAEIPIFTVLFEHQPNFARKWAQKRITFRILQNTGYKKNVLLQPPTWPKIGVFFFSLSFLKEKHWCWPKTQLKTRKKERQEKGIWKTKEDRKPPQNRRDWWSCSFQRNKETKTRKPTKSRKEEKKEGRKKEENKKDREREREKGQGKRQGEAKGDWKISQNTYF